MKNDTYTLTALGLIPHTGTWVVIGKQSVGPDDLEDDKLTVAIGKQSVGPDDLEDDKLTVEEALNSIRDQLYDMTKYAIQYKDAEMHILVGGAVFDPRDFLATKFIVQRDI